MASAKGRQKPRGPGGFDSDDGRVRRGEKNRERIVDALFVLVESGELIPTAEQVARQAGVGERTVFRHFADMETLFAEISGRMEQEIRPLLERSLTSGSLSQRVRALVEKRAQIYERISPFKRAGALQRPTSEFVRRQHAMANRELREHLVAALDLRETNPDTLELLDLFTSFEMWDRLRRDQRLPRERAMRVVEAAVLKLLAGG